MQFSSLIRRIVVLSTLAMIPVTGHAQTSSPALVTFYTHAPTLQIGLPGTQALFSGSIFEDDTELFSFRPGFIKKNNLHITLMFPAGLHHFKTYPGTDSANSQPIPFDLKPGGHYYLKVSATELGIAVVQWQVGHIDDVVCDVAQREIKKAKGKVLQPKNLSSTVAAIVIADQTLSPCH